jgi:hypothetical protein
MYQLHSSLLNGRCTVRRAHLILVGVLACSPTRGISEGEQERLGERGVLRPADTLLDTTKEQFLQFDSLRLSEPSEDVDELEQVLIMGGQMALATLGFGAKFTGELDPPTMNAVRAYQHRRGLPVNGTLLDPLTYDLLQRDEKAVSEGLEGIHPGSKLFMSSDWDAGSFIAKGGWRATNSKLSADVQAAYIYCDRQTAECLVHLAQISDRKLDLGAPEPYQITSWDKAEIRAVMDYPCARYVLVVSRIQKTVEATRTTLSQGLGCQHMDATSIRLELYDGKPGSNDEAVRLLNLSPHLKKILQPEPSKPRND